MYNKFLFIILLVLTFTSQTNAQTFGLACPDFVFERNMQIGAKGDDVHVLQKILNSDGRTVVSYSGLGAPGNETFQFGVKTREALKRFQALFIEYIQVADGKFNEKTRKVMNAVCHGPYFTGQPECGVFNDKKKCNIATTTEVVVAEPLKIQLFGPAEIETLSDTFRVLLVANRPIKTPSLSGLIMYNATAQDFRKISPTSFTFAVYPNQDARNQITLQIEADAIADLKGIVNEIASNELIIKIKKGAVGTVATTTTASFPDLDALLAQAGLPSIASSTLSGYSGTCPSGYTLIDKNFAGTSIAEGAIKGADGTLCKKEGVTSFDSDNDDKNSLLQDLLKMLPALMAQAKNGGGSGQACGVCMCPGPNQGMPVTMLTSFGGGAANGGYNMALNPGSGMWTGKVAPFPSVCGQAVVNGRCVSPNLSSGGCPFIGLVPPSPTFKWQN